MDWNKFLAFAALALYCTEEICDYVRGENLDECAEDRACTAIGGALVLIDKLKIMKDLNKDESKQDKRERTDRPRR